MMRQIAIKFTAPTLTYMEQRIHTLEVKVAALTEQVRKLTAEADEAENNRPVPEQNGHSEPEADDVPAALHGTR